MNVLFQGGCKRGVEKASQRGTLYRSPDIVRVIKPRRLRWAGHLARMENGRRDLKILAGKITGKIPLERPRHRLENNIRMDFEK